MRILISFILVLPAIAHAADPHAEARAIISAQCSACHRVPGVPGALGDNGPSLKGLAKRPLIAAKLPNTQANMVRWLMHPQQVLPGNPMPEQGLTQDQARKLAAYLATLDQQ